MRITLALGLLAAFISSSAFAETAEGFELAVNNAGDVFIQCGAYYAISEQGMKNKAALGGPNAQSATESAKSMYKTYYAATATGLELFGDETLKAKFDSIFDEQHSAMESDFKNYARLLAVYAKPCKIIVDAYDDPKVRGVPPQMRRFCFDAMSGSNEVTYGRRIAL